MAKLLVKSHDGQEETIQVDSSRFVLGRQSDCDLHHVFKNVAGVSRQHACILQRDNTYVLHDLDSRNGTRLNHEKISNPVPLCNEDVFSVAGVEFQFLQEDELTNSGPVEVHEEKVSIRSTVTLSESRWLEPVPAKDASRKLDALVQLLADLGESFDVITIYQRLLAGLFHVFPEAQHGFVAVLNERDEVVPRAKYSRGNSGIREARTSETVMQRVIQSREAVLSSNASSDRRFQAAQSVAIQNIQSIMCVPLMIRTGDVIGMIQLESGEGADRFNSEDLEILASITPHVSMALEYARLHAEALARKTMQQDLEFARQIQRNFLPANPPEISGLQFYSYYQPAQHVGGDHFDYFILPGGRIGAVISDVAGKGISAALLMSRFASEFKYILSREQSLETAVAQINEMLCADEAMSRYITLAAVIIDPDNEHLSVINAGHTPVILQTGRGHASAIGEEHKGMPVGMLPGQAYQATSYPFHHGDTLVMYTDGVNEATNDLDAMFGLPRILGVVADGPCDAEDLGEHLVREVRSFVGGHAQSDDLCIVSIHHQI